MYEKLLTETERFLAQRKEPLIPIKTLWQSLHREGLRRGFAVPSLVNFSCLLEGDKRFEVALNGNEGGKAAETDLLDYEEMEKLGFLGGQFVRLRQAVGRADDEEDNAGDIVEDEDDLLLDRGLLAEPHTIVKVKKKTASAAKISAAVSVKKRTTPAKKKAKVKRAAPAKKKTKVKRITARRKK